MPAKYLDFSRRFTALIDAAASDEQRILDRGAAMLAELIAVDDWLPEAFAQPHPRYYQQYLLHADPQDRFSVVSFVWGPGQTTPIYDHTVWAIIGVLRGAECSEMFSPGKVGQPMVAGPTQTLRARSIETLSPAVGDIHRVSNAFVDQVSISIHVYGGNIGKISRHVFNPQTSEPKAFVSGYCNAP
ncbi:cysteine dioxygenase type I family protein [Bordetella holmesii 30539]|nr:cysteine dioxygenase type I family protein [Bordetella holmesii ATCC 51541]AIT26309.1 cysteine dioxygenase type I family protein [Bordetella holmesii 44057]EWM44390.1 cysteine dioxygenase type I family protein [Bordetella holmesii 41130]EWM46882.1 cysteine dioxygenase type I family protein [Bordetella holmesii 35009]EWM51055.1 cysteine dioxygenase type I family protein [Bordetella holmesii 70147]EXF89911.1 cysteine dioxygenase type I family protein [Bordetella holmesii 30539]EXX96120.1 cys